MEVTKVERVSRYKVTVFFDEDLEITLKRRDAEAYCLLPGAFFSDEDFEALYREVLLPEAKKKAMNLLLTMDRTRGELKEKLLNSGFGERATLEAIEYVEKYGYIDDDRYKMLYVENRASKKSPMEIISGLIKKGISRDEACEAVKKYYPESRQEDTAYELLKKRKFDPFEEDYRKKQKHINYLARKGFSFDAILAAEDRIKTEFE